MVIASNAYSSTHLVLKTMLRIFDCAGTGRNRVQQSEGSLYVFLCKRVTIR